MEKNLLHFTPCIALFQMFVLAAMNLFAQAETDSIASWGNGFVKTNGQYVTIGDAMFETNSPANTYAFKHYMWLNYQLMQVANSRASNATDMFAEGAFKLIKEYPNRSNGFEDVMWAIDDYQHDGKSAKARVLANDLIASTAPDKYKIWAHGFLNRLDSVGKPVFLKFTAVDGREVDLARMKGKVVLVDFWATTCGPCVEELPRIKAAYDRFHGQGLEVIGISCDTKKERLNQFLKGKALPWPQYFDGKQQGDNKFTLAFGIDGIPHMFLVDKKGFLHFDNVRAGDAFQSKGDIMSFEDKIASLLAEQ